MMASICNVIFTCTNIHIKVVYFAYFLLKITTSWRKEAKSYLILSKGNMQQTTNMTCLTLYRCVKGVVTKYLLEGAREKTLNLVNLFYDPSRSCKKISVTQPL